MTKKKIKINNGSVRAFFVPDSFNEEDRTIDVVWSTGSKGKRYSWSIGEYYEELSMKKKDVDLSRLNNNAPVLKDHWRYLDNQIGKVEKAWIKGNEGMATLRFSAQEQHEGIIRDIQGGIITNVSVGYRVEKYEDVSKKKDAIPTLRAVEWIPHEISFVPVAFDDAAQSRSMDDDKNQNNIYECELLERQEGEMPKSLEKVVNKEETRNDPAETPAETAVETPVETPAETPKEEIRAVETPAIDAEAIKKEAKDAEKARHAEIHDAVNVAGLDKELAQRFIDEDNDMDHVRKEIFSELAKKNNETKTQSQNIEVNDVEKREEVREAVTRAIMHREDISIELKEGDRQFLGGSLLDTAREVLASEGVNVRGLHGMELAKRSLHHSSDFSKILENVSNKTLMKAYGEAPQTFQPFTRETSAKDFKEISKVQMGMGTGLEKVNEHGEYKRTTLSEGGEKYKVEKYGKILGFTWELLVNDDVDAFARVPAVLGRKARAKESELIYKILNSNPLMGDGNNLFHANHGNLGTAGVISETTMTEMRQKFRTQKDLDGELLNLLPKYLYVPSTLETAAEKFLTSILANKEADVNVFSNKLIPIVEPLLDAAFGGSDTGWYVMGDKGVLDMVELARLGGQGPQMFTREGFDVDGMETKIRYVFGVKAIDHRGFFKNAGV